MSSHHRAGSRFFKLFLYVMFIAFSNRVLAGQAEGQSQQKPSTPTEPGQVETQKIETPPGTTPPPVAFSNDTGSMQASDLKALLAKVRFAEFRVNDLLTDVRPERWKLPATTLESFNQSLKTLHTQVTFVEDWRAQFEQRTDSLYLGFQTYSAINSLLPRLDGVARSVAQHETPGYAAQFSEVSGQLFDMQETIGRYVSSLLKNQDQLLVGYQHSVATCQEDLSVAMRGQSAKAKPMRNAQPIRPQRRTSHQGANKGGEVKQAKPETKSGNKPPATTTKQDQKKN